MPRLPFHPPAGSTPATASRTRAGWRAIGGALAAAALAASGSAFAHDTPEGLWRTIDDATGQPRGVVEITQTNGVYSGRLVGSLIPADGAPRVCDKCTDARRGQPLIGMTILSGLRKTADNTWSGGEILDPENGKIYKSKVALAGNGDRLEVRGFIGISLLGRTQTWERER